MEYRKKPGKVEAVQVQGRLRIVDEDLAIEHPVSTKRGDWLVFEAGILREVLTDAEFHKTYEPVPLYTPPSYPWWTYHTVPFKSPDISKIWCTSGTYQVKG